MRRPDARRWACRVSVLATAAAFAVGSQHAAAATAFFDDPPDDNLGSIDIKSMIVVAENGELTISTFLNQQPLLPGDHVTWHLDADGRPGTGDDLSGAEWQVSYFVSSYSGRTGSGIARYNPASGFDITDEDPATFSIFGGGGILHWKASLADLGIVECATVRLSATSSYQGRRDWAPDGVGKAYRFNVCTGEVVDPPRITTAMLTPRRLTTGGGALLRVRSTVHASLRVATERKVGARWKPTGRSIGRSLRAGVAMRVPVGRSLLGPRPAAGSYRLVLTARAQGGTSVPRKIPFSIRAGR